MLPMNCLAIYLYVEQYLAMQFVRKLFFTFNNKTPKFCINFTYIGLT